MMRNENRLTNESSIYLRQHSQNPVDWYPWCDEAFERAKELDCPIFLSIGYSSCHWCHVMEQESFEDMKIAKILNDNFISIKVDREERPDIDELYIAAVQAMTGRAGWPLSLFLLPDKRPFFGGTYFPPRGGHGVATGFEELIKNIAEHWQTSRDQILAGAGRLCDRLASSLLPPKGSSQLAQGCSVRAVNEMDMEFDSTHGGFGDAPKFPMPPAFEPWLECLTHPGKDIPASIVKHRIKTSLTAMARGGICDQVGGGFHRYSTDAEWHVPHFEKMLYDNALLARVYLLAGSLLDEKEYLRCAERTLDCLLYDFETENGLFCSSIDADFQGVEGLSYLFSQDELVEALGEKDATVAAQLLNITEKNAAGLPEFSGGTPPHQWFEGRIPRLNQAPTEELDALCKRLVTYRKNRGQTFKDSKVLMSWNAYAISAFAESFRLTGNVRHGEVAQSAIEFLVNIHRVDGQYLSVSTGRQAKIPAYLEDLAAFALALLDWHKASGDRNALIQSEEIARQCIEDFAGDAGAPFYFTTENAQTPLLRICRLYGGVQPSGNEMMVAVLRYLFVLTGNTEYKQHAMNIFQGLSDSLMQRPRLTPILATEYDRFFQARRIEAGVATKGWEASIRKHLRPGDCLIVKEATEDSLTVCRGQECGLIKKGEDARNWKGED